MKYRYLTFDCYGTLIDWRAGIEAGLRSALGEVGLGGQELLRAYVEAEQKQETGYKKYREVLRDTAISLSTALGKRVDGASAEAFASSVPGWPAFTDTGDFLREMGSRGYKRYILSNIDNDLLEQTIERNHLDVDGFVTAEEVGSYKPDPGHWREFMARTSARRDGVLHVAQSVFHDIVPTQRLGIASAWVNRYHEAMPKEAHPQYVSDTLAGLAEVLNAEPA
ncbi:MAG TPA: HAD-IA family hydrolase [Nitrososphaerales archaeon]|nr:HAD-IA family hydrolase [Nitrososphaerales archaeon]